MHVVVIPATPLLVRAAGGRADPVAELRATVHDVLGGVLRDVSPGEPPAPGVVVLGTGPTTRAGRLRPTLAAAGVSDALLPVVPPRPTPAAPWEGTASTGPSVALLALADAGLDIVSRAVDVVELPAEAPDSDVAAAVRRVGPGPDGGRLLVVADHPGAGVEAVLAAVLGAGRWRSEAREVTPGHEHLPESYRVTVHRRDAQDLTG